MKLRVVELLLVTTLPALVIAQNGIPSVGLSIATILGGTLAAGANDSKQQYSQRINPNG